MKRFAIFLIIYLISMRLSANDFNFMGIPLLPNMSIESFSQQLVTKGFKQISRYGEYEGKYWNFSSARIVVWSSYNIVTGFKVESKETQYFASLVQALIQKHGQPRTADYGEESYMWVKNGGTMTATRYNAQYFITGEHLPARISIAYQIVDTSHNSDL